MKLTTYIIVHYKAKTEDISLDAKKLMETIRSFATIPSNHAFWDAESANAENCILVYGSHYGLEEAKHIKCDDIEKELLEWCCDVAEYLQQTPDDYSDCGSLDVEIEDVEWAGGMHVTCNNKDNEPPYVLWVLPIQKEEA